MDGFVLSPLPRQTSSVEVVERKGIGHPDTICDALAERLSRDLCAAYRSQFGAILHHNVDKALLRAGRSLPAFGGGKVEARIEIYLGGRATTEAKGKVVPVAEIAIEGARSWLRAHLHALEVDRHVRIHPLLRPGSEDLRTLFARGATAMPRANDTSIGVGYAPLSPLEQLVLAVERMLSDEIARRQRSPWGEDIKVMGVRTGSDVSLTISCALIGRYLQDLPAYLQEKAAIEHLAQQIASAFGFPAARVVVNAADDPDRGEVYLTVTGTSAEAGDDGQVGRGNRINGLITPGRPMSLEAAAGKNPLSHVGKIYNVAAREIATRVVTVRPEIARAECLLVSRIGAPIDQPAVAEVRIELPQGAGVHEFSEQTAGIVAETLAELPMRIERFIESQIELY